MRERAHRRLALLLAATCFVAAVGCADNEPTEPVTPTQPTEPTPSNLSLTRIGGFVGGGPAAAEITAYDSASKRLFVVNGAQGSVDVLDMALPSAPTRVGTITVTGVANSVDVRAGIVAVAVEATNKTDNGRVAFYRAATLQEISSVTVGPLPDMLVFSPDGRYVVVANEGEPSATYAVDPEGSVSVVDVQTITAPTVRTASFSVFNSQAATLRASGVRIYGPNATVAQDLEPEYVAISSDSRTAWVTLQENNAIATVDLAAASVTAVRALGFKDHSRAGNGLDVSDRDSPTGTGAINIRTWPGVLGMYQPDAIAAYTVGGTTYLVTANEGDARDWPPGLVEEARVSTLTLNPSVFTDAACGGPCRDNARLGRLTVTKELGRNATTGQYDALYVLGGRSFSIWNATTGAQVWDSGDQFEQRTTTLPNALFNASNTGNALDDRSDNKGPEPEGLALATFGNKTFAFIGLERVGGVMVYDISNPAAPSFVTYASGRNGDSGDQGPEGVHFIPARRSPNGQPLLVIGNELSGTTAIFQINQTF